MTEGAPLDGLRRAREKWRRDAATPASARIRKARTYVAASAAAHAWLRAVDDVGNAVRTEGKPRIDNLGYMRLGTGTVLRSITVPVELATGPSGRLLIGRDCFVNVGSSIYAASSVEIGDRVLIGSYVCVMDTNFHDLHRRDRPPAPAPVVIEDDVWIGVKASVLPGVRVGRGAVVSAHALVRRDVEPFTVVAGVPAVPVSRIDEERFGR